MARIGCDDTRIIDDGENDDGDNVVGEVDVDAKIEGRRNCGGGANIQSPHALPPLALCYTYFALGCTCSCIFALRQPTIATCTASCNVFHLKFVSLALRSLFTYCTVLHLHGGEPTITNCTVFQFHFASLAQCLTCKCFALAVISLHGVANLQSAHVVHYCSLLFCFYKIFV